MGPIILVKPSKYHPALLLLLCLWVTLQHQDLFPQMVNLVLKASLLTLFYTKEWYNNRE